MECANCNAEIQSVFKYAISKNECPVCGKQIMDEETMGIIEDIKNTIRAEATLREETAKDLAMVIAVKYNISAVKGTANTPKLPQEQKMKVAEPSMAQQIVKENANIVKAAEIADKEISDAERDKIMEEAVMKKYNMSNQILSPADSNSSGSETQVADINFGGADNPILEKMRLAKLEKQQQAVQSGTGSFRRG